VGVGSVLVYWSPFSSGKTYALKDLTVKLQNSETYVKYIDGEDSVGCTTSSEFLFRSIGLPKESIVGDIGNVLPDSSGSTKTTIIIDHFEALMRFPDTESLIRALARECYDKNAYRVLLCITPLDQAVSVLKWNGGHKIRLAFWPHAARWDSPILDALVRKEFSTLAPDQIADVVRYASICGSPGQCCTFNMLRGKLRKRLNILFFFAGKVKEFVLSSQQFREELSHACDNAWKEADRVLRPIASVCGFMSPELDADLH
jgi:hypothetical protein